MKKLESIKKPLFSTMEAEKMNKIAGGIAVGGQTWTLAEVVITYKRSTGTSDTGTGEPAQWDSGDAVQ